MIPYILFTVGLLLRSLQIMIQDFRKTDFVTLGGGILLGLMMVGKLAEDYQSGDLIYPWVGFPIGFSIAVAFGFKERILTMIGEGTVLLYGLIGGYLYVSHMISYPGSESIYTQFALLFIAVYISMAAVAAFTSFKPGVVRQVVYMIMYMAMSIGIGVWMVMQSLGNLGSTFGLVFVGYSSLVLLANAFYILYFIPYTGKRQSLKDRLENIKRHAQSLEDKYIAVGFSVVKFFILAFIMTSLGLLDIYTSISLPVLAAMALSVGFLAMKPSDKNPFMPQVIYDKL